jgi:hypothetical protein
MARGRRGLKKLVVAKVEMAGAEFGRFGVGRGSIFSQWGLKDAVIWSPCSCYFWGPLRAVPGAEAGDIALSFPLPGPEQPVQPPSYGCSANISIIKRCRIARRTRMSRSHARSLWTSHSSAAWMYLEIVRSHRYTYSQNLLQVWSPIVDLVPS